MKAEQKGQEQIRPDEVIFEQHVLEMHNHNICEL